VVLGTVNAGPHDFRAGIADLETFHRRWPDAVRALMAEPTPIGLAPERILRRPLGIKSVISFQHCGSSMMSASSFYEPTQPGNERNAHGDATRPTTTA